MQDHLVSHNNYLFLKIMKSKDKTPLIKQWMHLRYWFKIRRNNSFKELKCNTWYLLKISWHWFLRFNSSRNSAFNYKHQFQHLQNKKHKFSLETHIPKVTKFSQIKKIKFMFYLVFYNYETKYYILRKKIYLSNYLCIYTTHIHTNKQTFIIALYCVARICRIWRYARGKASK